MTKMDNIAKAIETKQGRLRLAHCMAQPLTHGLVIPIECDTCAKMDSETGCEDFRDWKDCYRPIGIALTWNEVESSIGDTKTV